MDHFLGALDEGNLPRFGIHIRVAICSLGPTVGIQLVGTMGPPIMYSCVLGMCFNKIHHGFCLFCGKILILLPASGRSH